MPIIRDPAGEERNSAEDRKQVEIELRVNNKGTSRFSILLLQFHPFDFRISPLQAGFPFTQFKIS